MRAHVVIWGWTLAVGLVAALVALVIAAEHRGYIQTTSAAHKVAAAVALIETDPGVSNSGTQRAIRAAATEVEAGHVSTAAGYYILAMQYRREMSLSDAEALFRRAMVADPAWSRPCAELGSLLGRYASGRGDEAIEVLQKAAQLDPSWSRPYILLSVILRQEERLEEAYAAGQKALELDPEDMANHNNFANLLIGMNRYKEAEAQFAEAIRIQPDHPKPYYNLACLYALEGKLDFAIQNLEHAITLAPNLRNTAATDPDLEAIRWSKAFKKLIYGKETRGGAPPTAKKEEKKETTTATE